jgi:hypothetical protein
MLKLLKKTLGGAPSFDRSIVDVFQKVCDDNIRTNVILRGRDDSYGAMFVGLKERADEPPHIFVDTFVPRISQSLLEPGKTRMILHFTQNNIPTKAECVFDGPATWEGYDALRLVAPTSLDTQQRREYYRVEPRYSDPVYVKIKQPFLEDADVVNISQGGVYLRTKHRADIGDALELHVAAPTAPECWLGMKATVVAAGDLHNAGRDPNGVRHYMRIMFADPDPELTRAINRYIIGRQREELKMFS